MSLSNAQRRQAHLSGLSSDIAQEYHYEVAAIANKPHQTELASGFLAITNVAYWVYIGQNTRDVRAAFVRLFVSTAGAGARVQEFAVATSVSAPDRAVKSLTVKAVANTTGDYVAGTGSFTNTVSFDYLVNAGTHVWVGCRFAAGTTQPTLAALGLDTSKGEILSTAAAGVLAVNTVYTGALITQSATLTTAQCPNLELVLG